MKHIKSFSTSWFLLLPALYVMPFFSEAAESPVLSYHSTGNVSGQVPDGYVLGKGTISYSGSHRGFQLWSSAPAIPEKPGSYELAGLQHNGSRVRVKLQTNENWQPAADERGLTIRTEDETVSFELVVEGKQQVSAGNYSMDLKTVALLPE